MGKCKNCEFWKPSRIGTGKGICDRIKCSEESDNPTGAMALVFSTAKNSVLRTDANFGCELFEPKNDNPTIVEVNDERRPLWKDNRL